MGCGCCKETKYKTASELLEIAEAEIYRDTLTSSEKDRLHFQLTVAANAGALKTTIDVEGDSPGIVSAKTKFLTDLGYDVRFGKESRLLLIVSWERKQ